MKHIGVLLLMTLLLCGCVNAAPPEAAILSPVTVREAVPRLSQPVSPLEEATGGAIRTLPLGCSDCCGLMAMGEDLLVIRDTEDAAVFIRFHGSQPVARAQLEIDLSAEDFQLQVWPEKLVCYDSENRQLLILNGSLEITRLLSVPEDMTGAPLLSRDGELLYYCTKSAIRCLDLGSGISRLLKEDTAPGKSLTALHLEETVLQCRCLDSYWGERYLFLCTQTGRLLEESSAQLQLQTDDGCYFAAFPNGAADSFVYGDQTAPPRMLLLEDPESNCVFLSQHNAAVTLRPSGDYTRVTLEYYDLTKGNRTASISFSTELYPQHITPAEAGKVAFLLYDPELGQDTLCLWDPAASALEDPGAYDHLYYSRQQPDTEGLARLEEQARQLGEHYGIEILIWKDAVQVQPWDYDLEPEHQTHLIERELKLLEQRLDRYPEGFLPLLAEGFDGLTICLVRGMTGSAQSGSLDSANGIQFWQGNHAFIVLAIGETSEMALYHELCHLIDTRVFTYSNAYDSWEDLNPGDFRYDYDYIANRDRSSYQFLQEHSRSFIDMYAMSFPKEDRARIMEYAMTEGHEGLFQAPILQQKLLKLCTGIREAFDLEDYPHPLPWEQYLHTPLHP